MENEKLIPDHVFETFKKMIEFVDSIPTDPKLKAK